MKLIAGVAIVFTSCCYCILISIITTTTTTDATSITPRVQCYVGRNTFNTLPNDAALLWLPTTTSTFCFKQYEKSVLMNRATPNITFERVIYTWDAMVIGYLTSSFLTCDGRFETSDIETPNENVTIYHYRRYCFCCGDACNGLELDRKCPNNEPPIFTHRCHSAASINSPTLPAKLSLPLDCTSNQACFKQTLYTKNGQFYHWGCASFGVKGNCNQAVFFQEGTKLYKGCSCCGEFCNGARMDNITAENTYCREEDNRGGFSSRAPSFSSTSSKHQPFYSSATPSTMPTTPLPTRSWYAGNRKMAAEFGNDFSSQRSSAQKFTCYAIFTLLLIAISVFTLLI